MRSEWPTTQLGDVCSKIGSGATPRGGKSVYLDAGEVALIRSQNVLNNDFSWNGLAYITTEHADQLSNVEVRAGDVLLNITGDSVARVCSAPEDALPARVNQHVAIIRPEPSKLNALYLRYVLVSPTYQDLLLTLAATGATRNALTKGMIETLEVPFPSITIQNRIAASLASIDDKIANNRALAADLEAMARAIFKSWFVDFDPVKAKMEGRAPAGMDADTAALFPDELVESELGLIPKGWEVATIADLCEIVGGATPSTKNSQYWDEGRHFWATPKDLSALSAPVLWGTSRQITDEGLAKISSGLLPEGTVLLSSRAPIGYLAITQVPTAINQGFIAMKPLNGASSAFLMLWAKTFMDVIVGNANGSTFQEISKKSFRPIQLVRPAGDVLGAFSSLASPLFDAVANLDAESSRLADLRDTLLPRLISGKLYLPEVEEVA